MQSSGRTGGSRRREDRTVLDAVNPIREPGWPCVEYVRTGMSKGDTVMRVMFDTIRDDMINLHVVAVRLGLLASGGSVAVADPQG